MTKEYQSINICIDCGIDNICSNEKSECKEKNFKKYNITLSKEEPMTKYYTRRECFEACGDDDIPFIRDGFNSRYLETKKALLNYDVIAFKPSELDSDVWQIKRAEKMVLSAAQSFEIQYPEIEVRQDVCEGYMKGFMDGDKNGQLREWLRSEQVELRRCVADVITHYDDDFYDLQEAYKNLKPPYEND